MPQSRGSATRRVPASALNNWTRKHPPPIGRVEVWKRIGGEWRIVKMAPHAATIADARARIANRAVVVFRAERGRDFPVLLGRSPALINSLREHLRDESR